MPRSTLLAAGAFAAALLSACTTTPPDGAESYSDYRFGAEANEAPRADYHVLMAEIALQRDQVAVAAREYRTAALQSADPELAARSTRIAFQSGMEREALESAEHWLSLAPDDPDAHRYLARLQLRRRNTGAVIVHLQFLLDSFGGGRGEAYLPLLALLLDEPETDVAAEAVRRTFEADTPTAQGAYAVASLALRAEQPETALRYAERATVLDPDWVPAGMIYARALVLGGQTEAGLEYARELMERTGETKVQLEYAVLLASAGFDEPAREELEAVLAVRPMEPLALP